MKWTILFFSVLFQLTLYSESVDFFKSIREKFENSIKPYEIDGTWPPKFCRNYECPKFEILDNKKTYQIRGYENATWLRASASGIPFQIAKMKMFRKLFKYIDGNNDRNLKIKMTVPVLLQILPDNTYNMLFYLAINNPPGPNDKNLVIEKCPYEKMYIRVGPNCISNNYDQITDKFCYICAQFINDSKRKFTYLFQEAMMRGKNLDYHLFLHVREIYIYEQDSSIKLPFHCSAIWTNHKSNNYDTYSFCLKLDMSDVADCPNEF